MLTSAKVGAANPEPDAAAPLGSAVEPPASIEENVSVYAAWGIPDNAVLVFEDLLHPGPDIVAAAHALDE